MTVLSTGWVWAAETDTFAKARTRAMTIYTGRFQKDIYCECKFTPKRTIDLSSCKYRPRINKNRGRRLEWEHVVPASYYYRRLPCGKDGRASCEKISPEFRKFEGDLHNLRPAVGELNADRSDLLYGENTSGGNLRYGACEFNVDTVSDTVEPPDNMKGDLARITLYISKKYNIVLPYDYLKLMRKWNEQDPVTEEEKEINRRIAYIQGDYNEFISKN